MIVNFNESMQLISVKYDYDEIGNQIEVETEKTVFCGKSNITQSEFYRSKELDLKIQYCMMINSFDYDGQAYARYNGVKYKILRTYTKSNDLMEVYLAEY